MVARMKEVGPNRFREDYGRYYEDFEIGHIYEHRPGRTITQADNTWFTLLTMNKHPLHFDLNYAKDSEFGKPLVNSAFTLAVVAGMSVSDVSQKTIANLGWDDIKLTARCSPAIRSMPNRKCSPNANPNPARQPASSRSKPPAIKQTARCS